MDEKHDSCAATFSSVVKRYGDVVALAHLEVAGLTVGQRRTGPPASAAGGKSKWVVIAAG